MPSLTAPPQAAAPTGALVRLTRFVLRHRRLIVAFWLLVTVAGIAATGPANRSFSDQFSVPGGEGFETNAAIVRTFGNGGDSAPLVPVVTLPRGLDASAPAARATLLQAARRIERAVPGVRIASYASTGDRAFVSRDGRTTFLLAYPPPQPGKLGRNPRALRAVRAALHGLTIAGAPVRLTGLEALSSPTGKQKRGLGLLAESLVGGLGALLVLGFVFASLLALVPLLMAAVSIMTCFLIVLPLTKLASVSPMVGFLIALVGLGVAIDYSLLIVVRWREERAHGHEGEEAIVRAMARAGRAVAFSGTTVAIGLLVLVVLPLPFLRSVGYAGMLIPLISVAVALTLLPLVLAKLGPRLDWPHVRREDRASRAWTRWATLVVRYRRLAAGVAVAVLAALLVAAAAMQLGPASGEPDALSQRGDASSGLHALERAGIGAGVLSPIEIVAHGNGAVPLAARLRGVAGVQGALAPAQAAWHRGALSVVDVLPHGDDRDTVARVRGAAHHAASDARVGGIVAQNGDFIDAVYGSFPLMLGLIALLTFLLLARAFRSLLLPAKAVVLNVVSVLAAWGALTLVWQDGDLSQTLWGIPATGSIPSWLPLIVFAFLYGLSMDYEVFILARMREEYNATRSTDEAVVRGIGRTGRLVTSAALILFLGFVSMATAQSTTVKMIATGLGAGILLDATIVRALLVPAAVALFGRWNWWLPPALARLPRTAWW
jgi:putative drug exporter of the RND superfamily